MRTLAWVLALTVLPSGLALAQEEDSALLWKSYWDLPLRFKNVTLGLSGMSWFDWDVDVPAAGGGSAYTVGDLSNHGIHLGVSIGLDFTCLDLRLEHLPEHGFSGGGTQTAPSVADASFDGDMQLTRLQMAFRGIGAEYGAVSGRAPFDLYVCPVVELAWVQIDVNQATSSLGTITGSLAKENCVLWGLGVRICARLRKENTLFTFELGWTIAGGRTGGSLDVDSRSEIYFGFGIWMAPSADIPPAVSPR